VVHDILGYPYPYLSENLCPTLPPRKQNAYRDLPKVRTSVTHPRISIDVDHVSVTTIQMMQPRRGCRRDRMRAKLWKYVRPVTWCVIVPLAFVELIFVQRFAWEFSPSIWRFAGSIFA
jgi:hypothetical protein